MSRCTVEKRTVEHTAILATHLPSYLDSVVEGSIFVGAGARARELSFQAMFTVASFLVLVVQGQVFVSSALFVSRRFNTKRIREREVRS